MLNFIVEHWVALGSAWVMISLIVSIAVGSTITVGMGND
jgi:hypothetical protein